MKKLEFKTLMYCGIYVNPNLLEKGIYNCSKPHLYNTNETIETIAKEAEQLRDFMGKHHVSDEYFENLKKCQLIPILIQEKYNPNNKYYFSINDVVLTPDGKGIIKKIEELYSGKIGYTCVLEKPYIITDPYQNIRDYNFPEYSFGYIYNEDVIQKQT